MIKLAPAAFVLFAAGTVAADETRQMDAHEHGVGQLDIAFDGGSVAMELRAPGADIVGFEYQPESAEDRSKIDAAVAMLARPLDLFTLPALAGCSVVEASASLESGAHDDDHGHDDHAKHEEDDHDQADHDHQDEDHPDHDHEDAADHTEFHAEYMLNCADPGQATLITFAYFDTFPNAIELEVQVISDKGATAFEVERDAPTLDLRDMF